MIKIYADLIIAHRKNIDDVPFNKRQEVIDELYSRGYDEHGDPIPINNGIES